MSETFKFSGNARSGYSARFNDPKTGEQYLISGKSGYSAHVEVTPQAEQ
jgi:hypothetical protein